MAAAGLGAAQRITPHVLRHNYGSLLVEAGENIAQVSRMLGHADASTTMRIYVHAVERAERRSRSLVGTFDRAPAGPGSALNTTSMAGRLGR